LAGLLVVPLGGCGFYRAGGFRAQDAYRPEEAYLAPDYAQKTGDRWALLPVVDLRTDRSEPFDYDKDLRIPVKERFEGGKRLTVTLCDTFAEGKQPSPLEVKEMEPAELATLGPKDIPLVLIIFLEYSSSGKGIVSTGPYTFVASTKLIHKPSQTLVWRTKATGADRMAGLPGIRGPDTLGWQKSGAIRLWMMKAFNVGISRGNSVPENPEKK